MANVNVPEGEAEAPVTTLLIIFWLFACTKELVNQVGGTGADWAKSYSENTINNRENLHRLFLYSIANCVIR